MSPSTGYDMYRRGLRAEAYSLWSEVRGFDVAQFMEGMIGLVTGRLKQAFREGAAECGVTEAEFSASEIMERYALIQENISRIPDVAAWIWERRKAMKGKLGTIYKRMELWLNGYNRVVNRAKSLVCADKKLAWRFGDTVHCRDCLNLNGRVYRGSVWAKYDIYPQSPDLECHGFNCMCTLEPTAEPATKGKPPRIAGQR